MKELTFYLKKYKKESILAPLFKMIEAIFELFVPLVISGIIDTGIPNSDKGYLLKMGGVLFALAAVGLASSVTAQYFAAKAAIGSAADMRNDLFRHINSFSYTEIDSFGTSTLITRLTNDVNQVQTGINMVLRLFLRSPFIVFGAMIMAFTINIKAALVFTAAIPLLFAVVFGIMFLSIPVYKKIQSKLDKITLLTRENLSGVRVIRAFNREEKEKQEFGETTDELQKLQIFVGRISALLNPVTYVILNLAIAALIWKGAISVNSGVLTQGAVVALVNYMSQILVELIKLSNLIVTINKASAGFKRIRSVMIVSTKMEFPEKSAEKKDSDCAVEFDNVSFCYERSKEPSLENISFRIRKGMTVGVIGATGSGKSTLVNLIPRFYDCTGGEVKLFGNGVKSYSKDDLNALTAVVPQKSVLFKGTLKDNIRWGKEDAADSEIMEAAKIAQCDDIIKVKGGLDFEIEQDGRNLSGGQKQRIAIARAIVKSAEILILDDSMSALDFATDARLRKAIKENTQNTTVFIVSQRASTVKNADIIIVLDDGRLAGIGTDEELFRSCEEYREICLSQLSGEEAEKNG